MNMGKCICCNKPIDEIRENYYGVIEKYHYDNRFSTTDTDTGPTNVQAFSVNSSWHLQGLQ